MNKNQKTTIALFNYGGGMRGLVPAHFMSRIEDVTGLRMADMVDIFAGPSTGAILNAAMNVPHPEHPGRPKYRARHLIKFYEREGLNIFPQDSFREFRGIVRDFNNRTLKLNQLNSIFRHGHYDPAHLYGALRALYGDTRLGDSLRTLVIPTYNIDGGQIEAIAEPGDTGDSPAHTKNNVREGGHAVWLKNVRTGAPAGIERQTPEVNLYDAVMASCAAPTYFPCHHLDVKYPFPRGKVSYAAIDGVIFDNPCISYLGAIRSHVPKDHRLVMAVLGTGYTNKSVKKEDWNSYGALGIVDPVNDLPLINIFFHASETALMDSFAEEMGDNLFVFNKPMLSGRGSEAFPSPQIDDASPENLKALQRFFEMILEENQQRFDDLCHILVNRRDQKEDERREQSLTSRVRHYVSLVSGRTPVSAEGKE